MDDQDRGQDDEGPGLRVYHDGYEERLGPDYIKMKGSVAQANR